MVKTLVPEKIETERLLLRPFHENDWDSLSRMFSDQETVQYTVKEPLLKWQVWRTLASYIGHWQMRGYGPYAVVEKRSGHMMGPVGLWYPGDWPEPEIKWSLIKDYWGQGYAHESAQAVKNVAFDALQTHRLISLILPENKRSIALSKRIGGHYEKTIEFRETRADIYVYSQK